MHCRAAAGITHKTLGCEAICKPCCLRAAGGDRRSIQVYSGGQEAIHPLSSMTE